MSDVIRPQTADDVRDAVRWATTHTRPLHVRGRGTKRTLGRPLEELVELDLSGIAGVTLYEAEELVLTAHPGTALQDVVDILAAKQQVLAFEPPDFGPLFGGEAGLGTLGGVIAANLSGPRRFKAGAARDHVLGVKAVSGFGEPIKSGGRVVKNVSGYDLSKLLTGSYGTLAALTEVTLKVLPRPESELTLAFAGLGLSTGAALLRAAAKSAAEPTGLAYLPAGIAARAPAAASLHAEPVALVRLEGGWEALPERADALASHLGQSECRTIEMDASVELWSAVRDVSLFNPLADIPLWRLSVPPTDAAAIVERVTPLFYMLDWGGGLIWLSSPQRPELERGSAVLFRGDDDARRQLGFMPEQEPALGALTRRVKEAFDPKGILNPGRMYEGV